MDKYEKIIGLAKRRGFLWNFFELYSGTAGFYDYGPLDAMLKCRIGDTWRKMYEIDTRMHEYMVNPMVLGCDCHARYRRASVLPE